VSSFSIETDVHSSSPTSVFDHISVTSLEVLLHTLVFIWCSQALWTPDPKIIHFVLVWTMPSVLWICWLGSRKGIRPVKIWVVRYMAWLSVWSEVQMICIWSSWCHCHPIISCSSKIQNVYLSGAGLHRLSWKKGPLNRCSSCIIVHNVVESLTDMSVCVCSVLSLTTLAMSWVQTCLLACSCSQQKTAFLLLCILVNLWPPYGNIFCPVVSFFFLFCPHLISAVADWMSTILPHMVWP